MARKGKAVGVKGKGRATREKPSFATAIGRMTILLEHMEEQNRVTAEGVFSLRNEFRTEMQEFRAEVNARFGIVESAIWQVKTRCDRIEDKLSGHSTPFDRIEGTLAEHSAQFDRIAVRFDRIEGKLAEHETRFNPH